MDGGEQGKQSKCVRNKVSKALVREMAFVWEGHHFPLSLWGILKSLFHAIFRA